MITVSKATAEDIVSFVKNIRPMDAEEVFRYSGKSIETQVVDLYEQGALVIKDENVILGIGGYRKGAYPGSLLGWMLLTKAVERHKVSFLKWSKRYVEDLLKDHKYIFNIVYKKNKLHMDYLKFLGATFFDEPGEDFILFRIERR